MNNTLCYDMKRENMLSEIRNAHYDIVSSVHQLENLYCKAVESI